MTEGGTEDGGALTEASLQVDADDQAAVPVFYGESGAFCAGWDVKYVGALDANAPLGELDTPPAEPRANGGDIPRGPRGPSRLELDKPVIAAVAGPAPADSRTASAATETSTGSVGA